MYPLGRGFCGIVAGAQLCLATACSLKDSVPGEMPLPRPPWYMDQGSEAPIPAMQPLSFSAHAQFGGVGWLIGELSCGGHAAFLVVGLVVIHC